MGMADEKNMGMAVSQSGNTLLEQLRIDFKLVWQDWWRRGEISTYEMETGMKEAGEAIKANKKDPVWMRNCAAHFAQMADDVRKQQAFSEWFRAEAMRNKDLECQKNK